MKHCAHLVGRGGTLALALGVGATVVATPQAAMATPSVGAAVGAPTLADARGPVPLNGKYVLNQGLDRQTYNGSPAPADPHAEVVTFATACDATGCVAHSSLAAQDLPFDFRWTGTQWKSVQHFQWTCANQIVPATVTYTLTPNVNGTLSGDRITVINAPGCGSARLPGTVASPLTGVPA